MNPKSPWARFISKNKKQVKQNKTKDTEQKEPEDLAGGSCAEVHVLVSQTELPELQLQNPHTNLDAAACLCTPGTLLTW